MKEAIALLEKALEVFSWCQEHADEKWMVDHLMAVRKDIDQALAILKQPKAQPSSEFTKNARKAVDKILSEQITSNLSASYISAILLEACDRLDTSKAEDK